MNEQDRVVLRDIAEQFRRIADALEPLEPVVKEWMAPRPMPILRPDPAPSNGLEVYVAVITVIVLVLGGSQLLLWVFRP